MSDDWARRRRLAGGAAAAGRSGADGGVEANAAAGLPAIAVSAPRGGCCTSRPDASARAGSSRSARSAAIARSGSPGPSRRRPARDARGRPAPRRSRPGQYRRAPASQPRGRPPPWPRRSTLPASPPSRPALRLRSSSTPTSPTPPTTSPGRHQALPPRRHDHLRQCDPRRPHPRGRERRPRHRRHSAASSTASPVEPRRSPRRPSRPSAPRAGTVLRSQSSTDACEARRPFRISYRQKPYRAVAGAPPTAGEKISTQRAKPASAGGRPQRRPTAKRRPSGGLMPPEAAAPPGPGGAQRSEVRQRGLIQGSAFEGGSGGRPRTRSATFSPIMIDGALRLPLVIAREDRAVGDAQALDPDHPAPRGRRPPAGRRGGRGGQVPQGW